jgi:hypothetical protein
MNPVRRESFMGDKIRLKIRMKSNLFKSLLKGGLTG